MSNLSPSIARRPVHRDGIASAIAWHPRAELELTDWCEQGRRFGVVGRNIAWWIGDWLRYGNARYGERYPRAAKLTGYDVQSLMNMVWVAARFSPERRHAALSWSHHAEVAALAVADQDAWLARAEQERMSVRCLRTELRSTRQLERRTLEPEPEPAKPTLVCPHCGWAVPPTDAATP